MQKGFSLKERDFFKEPFTYSEIKSILKETSAGNMFNYKNPSFKKLKLETGTLNDDELIDLMLKEPRLIRRPVATIDGATYFGASQKVLAEILNA